MWVRILAFPSLKPQKSKTAKAKKIISSYLLPPIAVNVISSTILIKNESF